MARQLFKGLFLQNFFSAEIEPKEDYYKNITLCYTLCVDKPDKRNQLNDLIAREWIPETISVFIQKGLGSNHQDTQIEKQHPAPYSFQDIARLIKFFTKKGQRVLDPFLGIGSSLKACALNDREGVGIELVKKYYDLSEKRLQNEVDQKLFPQAKQEVILGDALKETKKFKENYFDFIVTSPPYWNILKKIDHKVKQRVNKNLDTKYSNDSRDLGNIEKYEDFIEVLGSYFDSCSRVLKPKKYMAIVVSDFRNKEKYYMFHADLANYLNKKMNFALKGVTILYQSRKSVFPYGYPYAYVQNVHHQYILIFQNVKK